MRRIAPLLLAQMPDSTAAVEPLLRALAAEPDFAAAWSMVNAVARLDPEHARARIEAATAESPQPTRAHVKRALDSLKDSCPDPEVR